MITLAIIDSRSAALIPFHICNVFSFIHGGKGSSWAHSAGRACARACVPARRILTYANLMKWKGHLIWHPKCYGNRYSKILRVNLFRSVKLEHDCCGKLFLAFVLMGIANASL